MIYYAEEKQSLINILANLKGKLELLSDKKGLLREISWIEEDLYSDSYSFVTVGEFKNGKSTFVNALLEEEIMPVGVTPTTATINVVKWDENRQVVVHKANGTTETKKLTKTAMEQYIASAEFRADEIDHLLINLSAPVLKDKVVLIDTPGVNDINTLHPKITYEYIPRADAILFVLNITTPLRKTEYDFFTETILKKGTERIIFIVNFIDLLEEDEIEEALESITLRLRNIPELKSVTVFPLSAIEALEGRLDNDQYLLESSGLLQIEEKLMEMLQSGTRSREKLNRYYARMGQLFRNMLGDIELQQVLMQQSQDALQKELNQLQDWENRKKDRELQIQSYIKDREIEINLMVKKSVDYLFNKIEEEMEEQILLFTGGNISHLVEMRLPTLVKKRLKNWIERYSTSIHELLRKLEEELSKGLSQSFQNHVAISSNFVYGIEFDANMGLKKVQKSDPLVTSSLIMGGASTLALILGAPLFLPIIGMVGLPFLQRKMLKNHLEEIKPELISESKLQLFAVKENFLLEVDRYISSSIQEIQQQTIHQYSYLTEQIVLAISAEKEAKKVEQGERQKTVTALELLKKEILQIAQFIFNKEEELKNERLSESLF